MNRDEVLKIAEKCLDEMYKRSNPSITWKKYKELYKGTEKEGFLNHKLDFKVWNRIYDKYRKKVPRPWINSFGYFILDYSPTTYVVEDKGIKRYIKNGRKIK